MVGLDHMKIIPITIIHFFLLKLYRKKSFAQGISCLNIIKANLNENQLFNSLNENQLFNSFHKNVLSNL